MSDVWSVECAVDFDTPFWHSAVFGSFGLWVLKRFKFSGDTRRNNNSLPKRPIDHMVASRCLQLVNRLMHSLVGTVMGRSDLYVCVVCAKYPAKNANEIE